MLRLRGRSPLASIARSINTSGRPPFSKASSSFHRPSFLFTRQYTQPTLHQRTRGTNNDGEYKWNNQRLLAGAVSGLLGLYAALDVHRKHRTYTCEEKEVKEIDNVVVPGSSEVQLLFNEPTTNVEKADVSRFWRDVFLPDLPLIISLILNLYDYTTILQHHNTPPH